MIRNHNPLHKSYYEQFADGTVKCIDEEIPFEIPESWEWCRGYTCFLPMVNTKPVSEFFRYIDIESVDNKKHCITSPKVIQSNKAPSRASRKLSSGDTLFSLVRPYLENIAFIDDSHADCIASTGFYVCKPNQFLNPKYCFRLMTSLYVIIGLNQYMKGDNSPSINNDNILSFLYPIPPYAEQQRIVFTIEQYNNLINELEENKEDLKQFVTQTKSKILDLAIRGKLVPQNPNDEPASVLLERIKKEHPESKKRTKKTSDNSHYPFEIPKNWEWCKLGEFNNIARGGSPRPIKDFLTESKDGINWIKIGDTEKGEKYIYSTREKITKEGIKHSRFVNIDDFLLTNSMSFGRPYILKTDGCIHDGWLVINIQKKLINMDFMYYLLSSDFMYTQFYKSAVGSTVKNLKTETVQQIPFPLPPILEQKRIVQKIEEIFASLDEIANSIIA